MRFWVIWNVWEEMKNLPRAVDSVARALPAQKIEHVFIDGKYPSFAGNHLLSRDGTRGFCQDSGWLLNATLEECEKRSKGLRFVDQYAKDGDYVLVLDADEEITTIYRFPKRVGLITFEREDGMVTYDRARLYKWEPGLIFLHRHYDLYDGKGELVASLDSAPEAEPCGQGIHHHKSHDKQRVEAKRAYYKALREKEGHPSE